MKQSLLLFFLLITIKVMAPTERFQPLLRPEPVNPYLNLYNASCFVESSHRAKVINEEEQAYGIVQIRQVKLDDYNKETGNHYILSDCLDADVSKMIWMHFASKYDHEDYEIIAKAWNRSKTDKYWEKIKDNL
jgi:predicted transcriptional regulator